MPEKKVLIKFVKRDNRMFIHGLTFGDIYFPKIVNQYGEGIGECLTLEADAKIYEYLKERGYNVSYTNDVSWSFYSTVKLIVKGKSAKAQFAILNSSLIEVSFNYEEPPPPVVLPVFTSI